MRIKILILILSVLFIGIVFEISGCAKPGSGIKKEVCLEHKCTMNNCAMHVKADLKPGERVLCPICGEVISANNSKAAAVSPHQTSSVTGQAKKILYYRNPMNPEVTSPVPMKDSMGMDYVPVYAVPAGRQEEKGTAGAGPGVYISPEKQQLIGIKLETIKYMDLKKDVRSFGKIAYDPELFVTQEEFIQALNAEESLKDSSVDDVVARTRSLADAARQKLKFLGMSDDEINGLEKTKKPQTNLYLPAGGENVWAYISIYEYEIGLVKTGSGVEIEAVAYPGEVFQGKVVSINPVLDPVTRTNQVRVEVLNPEDKLKPEMFVNATIHIELGEKLAVPETAVLDTGIRKIVYLATGDSMLESREVILGRKAEGYYEVLSGLREGDSVVVSGNFLVDSESRLKSVVGGTEHKHGQ